MENPLLTPGMILPLFFLGLAMCVLGVGFLVWAAVAGLERKKGEALALLIAAGVSLPLGGTMIAIAASASASI